MYKRFDANLSPELSFHTQFTQPSFLLGHIMIFRPYIFIKCHSGLCQPPLSLHVQEIGPQEWLAWDPNVLSTGTVLMPKARELTGILLQLHVVTYSTCKPTQTEFHVETHIGKAHCLWHHRESVLAQDCVIYNPNTVHWHHMSQILILCCLVG